MFIIGKPAEFASNNRPIRGQCQPHTKGWQLCYFSRGRSEVLYEDNYYTCREIQKACKGLSLEEAREKVKDVGSKIAIDMQETQRLNASGRGGGEPTRVKTLSDETPLDLPVIKEPRASSDATEVIPRDEMEEEARRHQRPGDF